MSMTGILIVRSAEQSAIRPIVINGHVLCEVTETLALDAGLALHTRL